MGIAELQHAVRRLRNDITSLHELARASIGQAEAIGRTLRRIELQLFRLEQRADRQLRSPHRQPTAHLRPEQQSVLAEIDRLKTSSARLATRIDQMSTRTTNVVSQSHTLRIRAGVSKRRKALFEPELGMLQTQTRRLSRQTKRLRSDRLRLSARMTQLEHRFGAAFTNTPAPQL
ncbi:hypothetical protein [Nocardia brasiliensis]